MKFRETPLYIFPDMDWQDKYKPQGENAFFADRRNARPLVSGAIARGSALDFSAVFTDEYHYAPALNPELFTGKDVDGGWVKEFPIPLTHELMSLGRDKFNIFCIVCHGASGDGEGITKKYGMVATPSYHDDRIRNMPVGEIFNTITNGFGQMNGYGAKLAPKERWAIIAYLRALQQSQNASTEDVPASFVSELNHE